MIPGRIQTVGKAGYYSTGSAKQPGYMGNGSFYLVDNPKYTYRWVDFDGSMPSNAVPIRNELNALSLSVTRVKVNGHMRIGRLAFPVSITPDDNGVDTFYENYEILVCDPWPKYQCGE
jgi:hypothetical protein